MRTEADGNGMRADIGFEKHARYVFCVFLVPVIFHPSATPTFSSSRFSFSLSPFRSLVFSFSRVSGGKPAFRKAMHYRVARNWTGRFRRRDV